MPNKKLRLSSETVYVLSDSATAAVAGGGGMSAMSGSWMAAPDRGPDIPPMVRRWAKPVALITLGVAAKAAYDHFEKK